MKRSSRNRHRHPHAKASIKLEPPGPLKEAESPAANVSTSAVEESAATLETQEVAIEHPPWNPSWLKWSYMAAASVIVFLGVLLYSHTLSFPFQFDDHIYLIGSPFVKEMKTFIFDRSFHEVANHSLSLGLGYDPSVNFILRPIAYLSFHLNYLMDDFKPEGFRAVNIGIHCINAVLLFLILQHVLRKSPKAQGLPNGSALFIPTATALLFIAHPLHTESVTYIVQRFTSMVCFFMLSSVLLHLLSLSASGRGKALAFRIAAVTATVAGMLTKESMFTAPLLIVMVHFIVMGGTLKRACWQALPHLLCMLILPLLVVVTSHAQTGSAQIGGAMQIAVSTKESLYQYRYFLTQLGVILEYVRLIIWPEGLNVDRQYQLATSVLQLRVWLSGVVIISILVAAWRLFRTNSSSIRHALITAGVFWFFLRLAVSSSFVPLDDLMVDHRTYGASMGLLTVLACALDLIRTNKHQWAGLRWTAPAALGAAVAVLSVATIKRNEIWQSETSLWSDAVMKSPGKARPWDNLGVCHYQNGREEEAAACLTKAVELNPGYVPGYTKLGVLFNARGQHAQAIEYSNKGLAVAPDSAPIHYNLGFALCSLGRIDEGAVAMENAVKCMPTMAPAHAALGQIYHRQKNYRAALHHFRLAVSLGFDDPEVRVAMNHVEVLAGPQLAN